jgi:hypothetical protein
MGFMVDKLALAQVSLPVPINTIPPMLFVMDAIKSQQFLASLNNTHKCVHTHTHMHTLTNSAKH